MDLRKFSEEELLSSKHLGILSFGTLYTNVPIKWNIEFSGLLKQMPRRLDNHANC